MDRGFRQKAQKISPKMCTGPFSRTRTHSLLTKIFLTIGSIVQDLAVGVLIGQVAGGGGGRCAFA